LLISNPFEVNKSCEKFGNLFLVMFSCIGINFLLFQKLKKKVVRNMIKCIIVPKNNLKNNVCWKKLEYEVKLNELESKREKMRRLLL
jgi:hypothetical protein